MPPIFINPGPKLPALTVILLTAVLEMVRLLAILILLEEFILSFPEDPIVKSFTLTAEERSTMWSRVTSIL